MKTDDEMYQSLLSRWEDYKDNKRKNKTRIILVPAAVLGVCFAFWVTGNVNRIVKTGDSDHSIVPAVSSENKEKDTVNPETRKLKKAIDPEKATKDDIFYMMLNSVDYYDKVSGRFIHKSYRSEYYDEVVFQTCLSETSSYTDYRIYRNNVNEKKIIAGTAECESENARYCDGESFISVYPKDKTWEYINNEINPLTKVVHVPDQDRITEKNGIVGYTYEIDPTNVMMSDVCLFPQEYAFGFLQDQSLWEVEQITDYQDRKCYVIKGTASESYGGQMNVSSFEFLVDTATGVLMRYDGYDENGKLRDFMHTDNIRFEEKAEEVTALPDNITEEYLSVRDHIPADSYIETDENAIDYDALLEPYRTAFDEFNKSHGTTYGFMSDEQLELHKMDKQQYLKEIAEFYSKMSIAEFYDYLENAYREDIKNSEMMNNNGGISNEKE